jgi:threonylcarbamoyladenosine tRNA methylthiotransferase MtaB
LKYAILTFGCRVNQADSFNLEEGLREHGGEPGPIERADLVLVNTCSVTATADKGARQAIRRVSRRNPNARIVVTGCYATRRPADLVSLPGVIRLVRNDGKDQLVAEIVRDLGFAAAGRHAIEGRGCSLPIRPGVRGRTAYPLRVQSGCSEQCSYCVIPSTRGLSRSRPLPEVIAEVGRAIRAGFKELVLTGVHLGSYGADLRPPVTLARLIAALDSREGTSDVLFRLSAIEPMDCTLELIDLVARSGRCAPHFHLPLQHASASMLRAMRRPYTLDSYRRIVQSIRDRLPDASIGADVLVGFPGETDGDFQTMARFLRESRLSYLHVFPYSDRPGTAAAAMTPKVPVTRLRERAAVLGATGRDLNAAFQRSQIGCVRSGLTLDDGTLVLTDNYLKVRIPAGRARNEWVRVEIRTAGEVMTGTAVSGHALHASASF